LDVYLLWVLCVVG